MFQSLVHILTGVGIWFASLCILIGAVVGTAMSTGIFFEQFGTTILKVKADPCVRGGLKTGAIGGFLFAAYALYTVGVIAAFFGVIGLCLTLLGLAFVTWYFFEPRYR